jgi:hypothetical protein
MLAGDLCGTGDRTNMDDETLEYKAESVDGVVSELFSGKLPIAEALTQLRTRLLDLSARNRLLAYRHPRGRCIQLVGNPNLNLLYERLLDSRNSQLKPVPEPEPFSYEGGKKPDARSYAERLNISTSYEFSPLSGMNGGTHQRIPALQTLFYPSELDKLLRKISSEARTVIEETGTNMLYLMFGFLEFYDSEDSERSLFAPLLSVPIALTRGNIDPDTRAYQYSLAYTGEDISENQTLREKLKQDFRLNLPEMLDEDTPETYFDKISQSIRTKKRWKVGRQLTLGFLSFGKLAIWADLDTKKWKGLLEHALLKRVFEGAGGSSSEGSLFAEDYAIDAHAQSDLPLIYDADSSQHSAIIDAMAGRDLVINGPPGTGKSQTITNIIASALSQGKKVLFVSEKLAALEVVKQRLEKAKLGQFCLELHSHKTQKRRLLDDVQARLDYRFRRSPMIEERAQALVGYKKKLNRYAELLSSRMGNELGLTLFDLFWACEKKRQELNDFSKHLLTVEFRTAAEWAYEEMERRRTQVESLASLYDAINGYNSNHPWWGFSPNVLNPGDDTDIAAIISAAITDAEKLVNDGGALNTLIQSEEALHLELLTEMGVLIERVPPIPPKLKAELLPRLFPPDDESGKQSKHVLGHLSRGLGQARNLLTEAKASLVDGALIEFLEVAPLRDEASALLAPNTFTWPLEDLGTAAQLLASLASEFDCLPDILSAPYSDIQRDTQSSFRQRVEKLGGHPVRQVALKDLEAQQGAVLQCHHNLQEAICRVTEFAGRFCLPYDGSPASVKRLADTGVLDGVLPGVRVDTTLVTLAAQRARALFGSLSISECKKRGATLAKILAESKAALAEVRTASEKAGFQFENITPEDIAQFGALVRIAQQAPRNLLEHRRAGFSHQQLAITVVRAEQAIDAERIARASLEHVFYLDDVPDLNEIKASIRVFRRGDSAFNFMSKEWRKAKRLHRELCKEKKKKATASECEERLLALASWVEQRQTLESSTVFQDAFGALFAGLRTDFSQIRALCDWYSTSHEELLAFVGMVDQIDLRTLDAELLEHLNVRAPILLRAVSIVETSRKSIAENFELQSDFLPKNSSQSWQTIFRDLEEAIAKLAEQVDFLTPLVSPEISLSRATQLLQATLELQNIQPYLERLVAGRQAVAEAGGTGLASLGKLPESAWPTYLDSINSTCTNVHDFVEFLKEYVAPSATSESAEQFIETKLKLDSAWAKLAPPSRLSNISNWQEFVAHASKTANVAKALHDVLSPHVLPGVAVSSANSAIRARDNAIEVLHKLEQDKEIQRITGEAFAGESTDLDTLVETHDWGAKVAALVTNKHLLLRRILLNSNGTTNLGVATELLRRITRTVDAIRNKLTTLETFGTFNWKEWQEPARTPTGVDLPQDLKARLEIALENAGAVLPWSKYLVAKNDCKTLGLGVLVEKLELLEVPPSKLSLAFEFVAYQSMGKSVFRKYPELSRFAGTSHEKLREEFASLDKEIIAANGREFAHRIDKAKKILEGDSGSRAGDLTEMNLLRRELNKQRRHIPIRQLLKRAGRTLQEIKPCFMMGPLSVAQYLEPECLKFDLVVMDEASQLRPEEALGAIARGSQLIVVGDPKQLPPTSFFDRLMDGGEEEESDDTPTVLAGMDSILDICQQLFHPVRTLRWHYRSRHESLIAFSNHHFYRNLIVFPSPYATGGRLGVRYRYIRQGAYKDRQNVPEAQRVVDAVLDHMIRRSDESLGVVTLNQTQRELIEDLLDRKLRSFEEGQKFLAKQEEEGWPFFIKNLENVQGDERDVIFISTTFGKAVGTDKIRQNFGPISRPDGWRRLNVLFTRARLRVELFTSMQAEDIVVDGKTPLGTKALRDYLDFARRGVLTTTDETDRDPDSDFEVAVANALQAAGYPVKPQHGVAGFYIDMVVRNPDRPGEFLAGVECDGATYHSSASARDRDRIRQEILEGLGWKGRIYRIWSTDWFFDSRREIKKLLDFLNRRRTTCQSDAEVLYYEEVPEIFDENTPEQPATPTDGVEVPPSGSDDAFVEVGDRITYCFVAIPQEKHTVQIVDSASNPKMNIVNENTPLALALLGCAVGEEGVIATPGRTEQKLRVLKIHRGAE